MSLADFILYWTTIGGVIGIGWSAHDLHVRDIARQQEISELRAGLAGLNAVASALFGDRAGEGV